MMRIITGRARGVRLATLAGENTRPTSERAKEAIFSMIQFELRNREVLDLFAGSGQMGLEALSRGAARATLCDLSKDAVGIIRQNATKTRLLSDCEILCADYETALRTLYRKKQFDLVFLDPPYALGAVPRALGLMLDGGLLSDGARVVCETGAEADVFSGDEALAAHFEILRVAHYGVACVTVLQKRGEGTA